MKKIGLILGSLRSGSNSSLLAANVVSLLKGKASVEVVDISALPVYNQDFDGVIETPKAIVDLRAKLATFDGFVFITPEHNRTMSAAMKNVIDIASRPWGSVLWGGKSVLVMGHSVGKLSAFGAVNDVKRVLSFLGARVMAHPELYLGPVHELLDDKGVLVPDTAAFVGQALDTFLAF